MPYDHGSMRSIYHVREYNIRRLSLLSKPDIFLSHDWPQSIEQYGDIHELLRKKPFFRQDINSGNLGSPPLMGLLQTLRPNWWFSAHLHVRFEAVVKHGYDHKNSEATSLRVPAANPEEIFISDEDIDEDGITREGSSHDAQRTTPNPDEIILDNEGELDERESGTSVPSSETRCIALDKCLPQRAGREIVEIEVFNSTGVSAKPVLTYDPEWLAITRSFQQYFTTTRQQVTYPDENTARTRVSAELEWVGQNIVHGTVNDPLTVDNCQVFVQTAPGPGTEGNAKFHQPPCYTNPQTVAFCNMLGIENRINTSSNT